MVKVAFVQFDVQKDILTNISKVSKLLHETSADIYLLPELCDGGYLYESRQDLQFSSSPINENQMAQFLKQQSQERNCTFIAGVAERGGDAIYNSAVLLSHGKLSGVYRKIHLSDLEKSIFTPGANNNVFKVDGVTVGIQICFDLWFPEISREQLFQEVNLFCVLANFGSPVTYEIARIRAIENSTPLVLCNRVGREKNDQTDAYFLGRSSIVGKDGIYIEKGIDDIEVCMIREIPLSSSSGNAISRDMISEIRKHYSKE